MTAPAPAVPRIEQLALADIKAHPDNPREAIGDVGDLAASITSVGLLEPLIVAPPHTGMSAARMGKATWLLIAGHRRLAAAKRAKVATVPVIIREDLTTRAEQIEAMLVENLQRTDLTPVEEADAYQLVMDIDGLTQKALAAKVGQPLSRVRARLKLTKIGDAPRKALHNHQCTIEQAMAIGEFEDDPDTQATLIDALASRDFAWTLGRAKQTREHRTRQTEAAAALAAAGVEIHDAQPDGTKPLSELHFEGTNYVSATNPGSDLEYHSDCPGRTAWWSADKSTLWFGCAQPKLHPKPKVRKTKAELERQAADKEAAEQRQALADVDATLRRDHIREVMLGDRTPDTLRNRARALVHSYVGTDTTWGRPRPEAEVFLDLLGLEIPEKVEDEKADREALAAAVDAAMGSVEIDQLLVVVDIALHTGQEADLRQGYRSHCTEWVQALTDYGYRWSPSELEHVPALQSEDGDA